MRKNLLISFVFILFSVAALAQKNNINFYVARSFHGTGDLDGLLVTTEFGHFFTNRLEISGNLTSTIHWGSFGLFINGPNGNFDGSFRYVTAGLQAGPKVGFAILNSPRHVIKLQGGSFIRYQSSSLPDQYAVTFPPAINYPEPVFTFSHHEKQNMITVGYLGELSYAFVKDKNLLLGAKAGFQNDTNGDVISHYGLFIGKKLGMVSQSNR